MSNLSAGSTLDHPSLNPYASPADSRISPPTPLRRANPWKALGRWTLICSVSAAPSFFWGCALHAEPPHLLAMMSGILVFIAAYTLIECSAIYQQVIVRPHLQRTALIGYGTRILISIILPVGAAVDMFLGVTSVSLVASLALFPAESAPGFLQVFITTIVQGVLLNVALLAYMAIVYGVLRFFAALRPTISLEA